MKSALSQLSLFTSSRSGGEGLLVGSDLAPLRRFVGTEAWHRPDLPRLALVGEVKAGKSTLLNALVRQKVAASDILEMTSWIARYWPATVSGCYLTHKDGTETGMHIESFVERCEQREWSRAELDSIDRVDVALASSDLEVGLIDCPGLGSLNRVNEGRMIEALEEADGVVWTVDVDGLGSLRDVAFLREVQTLGLPVIAVLTKCDLLDDPEEIEELTAYLSRLLNLPSDRIFPTAALPALECALRGEGWSEETGMRAFNRFLGEDVAPRSSELRQRAAASHARRVRMVVEGLVGRIEGELDRVEAEVEAFAIQARRMCEAVQLQLALDCEAQVRSTLSEKLQSALTQDLAAALGRDGAGTGQNVLIGVLRRQLGDAWLDTFCRELSHTMDARARALWSREWEGTDQPLGWEDISLDWSWLGGGGGEERGMGVAYPEVAAAQTLETSLKTSLGVAGAATAYAAWLGPAAAQLSLGAAVSGVGLPIALLGAGVSAALWHRERKGESIRALEAAELLDTVVDHVVGGVIQQQLLPGLAERNAEAARLLIVAYEAKASANLPDGSLDELRARAQAIRVGFEGMAALPTP